MPGKLPTLGKVLDSREEEIAETIRKKEERKEDKRGTYIITKYSGHWRIPMHKTLKRLRAKFGMKWLRVRMCYKRHSNLKELLLGDLSNKILENVVDATSQDKECNCMANKLVDGECFLSGDCQRANLIYKLFCGCCGDFYIGKTQNYVKKRTQTHINHVVKMWKIKQNYLKSLELTDGSSIFSPPTTGSNRSMTTRAMGRAARTSSPDPHTPDDPNAGIIALAALFTSPILTNEPPDDNSEVEEAESIQADHDVIDNIPHATEGLLPPSPGTSINSASTGQSSINLFRQEFGTPAGHPTTQEAIQHLVRARTQLYRPILDSEIKSSPLLVPLTSPLVPLPRHGLLLQRRGIRLVPKNTQARDLIIWLSYLSNEISWHKILQIVHE